jgi:small basic protein (TIGR04137 family)
MANGSKVEGQDAFFSFFAQLDLNSVPLFFFIHPLKNQERPMSQHNSFKVGSSAGVKKRNVLKRFERVDLLRKREEWKEGDRVIGLKKTKPNV